ncbi:MAG: DUF6572 domain-containing protein [Coprobacillaceae bacterium]
MAITETEQIDAIGRDGDVLKLMIVDFLDWKYEDMHLELLQDKINNYIAFIENKLYVQEYGDNFVEKRIDIHFQHGITANGIKFINAVSAKVNQISIFINIHLPEQK